MNSSNPRGGISSGMLSSQRSRRRWYLNAFFGLGFAIFVFLHIKTIQTANRLNKSMIKSSYVDDYLFHFLQEDSTMTTSFKDGSLSKKTTTTTTATTTTNTNGDEPIVNESPDEETDDKDETNVEVSISSTTSSPYAYVWIIGGIHEDRPSYKGFIWDVAVSVNVLRKAGSTADFCLLVRLSPDSKLSDELPDKDDMKLLDSLGVHIQYLEKPVTETFSQLMYDKFLILNMTAYKRVLFLDADTLPVTNMDYLFHLSDPDVTDVPTLLKPFLLYATRGEPANGGMFMVEPSQELYQQYLQTVQKQHESAKTLPYPHFDRGIGWGYHFRQNKDQWEGIKKNATRWDWWGAHVDQGLMYYVARILQPNGVSIAIGPKVQNWIKTSHTFEPQKPKLESVSFHILQTYQPPLLAYQYGCDKNNAGDFDWQCHPPYNSFAHFVGTNKPWQKQFHFASLQDNNKHINTHGRNAPERLWYQELVELNTKYEIGIDLDQWNTKYLPTMKESSLGYMPKYSDQAKVFEHVQKELHETPETNQKETEKSTRSKPQTNDDHETEEDKKNDPHVVAYAISFIKCGDHQNGDSAGLIDASLVLRHSIHQISSRNPKSGSKYDYKMYALVHRQAEKCSSVLKDLGFELKIVDPPIQQTEIQGEYLRTHIQTERCCGADEFIKLFAYTLPHEIIVHVDMDVAFYKPMDHLFDAILYDKDSSKGKAARTKIELERPDDPLPDKIGAFITRDWTQVNPGKWQPGYQAGFLIARYDETILPEVVDIIRIGNYTDGWGNSYGWYSKGYGGYVGAMAMQGLMAYYYDHVRTDNAVELNQCRYNHVGVKVKTNRGKCRNNLETCEDCTATPMKDIYNMHHTQCRKPWLCQATASRDGKKPGGGRATALNTQFVNPDHCLEMSKAWHLVRSELESSLYDLTKDESIIQQGANGTYRKDIFQGHCHDDGSADYIHISGTDESKRQIQHLYN